MLKSLTVLIKANRVFLAMLAAATVAITLAGCGGGGRGGGVALSRAELLTRGNGICADTAKRIKDAAPSIFPDPGQLGQQEVGRIETYAKTVVLPGLQSEYQRLGALKAPADSTPTQTLGELERAIDRWEKDKVLMSLDNDTSFARFDALANDFGFTACSMTDAMIRSITAGKPIT